MKYLAAVLMMGLAGCSHEMANTSAPAPINSLGAITDASRAGALSAPVTASAIIVGADKFSKSTLVELQKRYGTLEKYENLATAMAKIGDSSQPLTIYLGEGNYREKIAIHRDNLVIKGLGADKTHIIFDDYAGRLNQAGTAMGTAGSATLTIAGQNIFIEDVTIENDFNFLAQDALAKDAADKVHHTQAVALYLGIDSDKIRLSRVALLGYQDTLFAEAKRAHIADSLIAGNVDFIFGRGNLLIENSEVRTRSRSNPEVHPHSFITAASTKVDSEFGITLLNCRLTREPGVPDNSVALGRPWHPTTTFSDGRYADPFAKGKVIVANTWMDAHIMDVGWYWMGGTARDGTKVPMLPENARFFEHQSKGPGARLGEKRWQLPETEAAGLSAGNILSVW